VAPSSPLLVAGLEQAFGLRPGEAVVIQLPAVWSGGEDRALLRAAALAIHMHGCREVLVAGLDGDPLCPPARGAVRQAVQAAGLSPGSPELEQLQDMLNGPSSPTAGVLDTVRLLRSSAAVPPQVPVHGCLLSPDTGEARLIEQGRGRSSSTAAAGRKPAVAREPDLEDDEDAGRRSRRLRPSRRAGFELEPDEPPARPRPTRSPAPVVEAPRAAAANPADVVLAPMPEIALPDIPLLDLSALSAPPPAAKPAARKMAADYGRGEGSGPVPMAALQKMDVPTVAVLDRPSTQGTQIIVPQAVSVADTGLGDLSRFMPGQPEIQERPHVEPVPDVRPSADVAPKPKARPKPPKARPAAASTPAAPPPPPARRTVGTRVDLQRGVVQDGGQQLSLDVELHRALLKVSDFLAQELQPADRSQLALDIQRAAGVGEPVGELLKRVISPVLKMGKKRYAVINELLKLKEDLPRLPAPLAEAILVALLQAG